MAIQTTPHTQTQQDTPATQADLEPNQAAQESGQDQDAELYQNMDGAQTGGTRAFNANAIDDDLTFLGGGHDGCHDRGGTIVQGAGLAEHRVPIEGEW